LTAPELGFIHRFVPPAASGPAVTLLLLHGTGGNEDDLLSIGAELLPGAALLSPRGKTIENGMPRFFRRLSEGVFDLEDLKLQTDSLARFIAAAAEKYGLGERKMAAVGYSNGANIAASVMLTRPKILNGAILFRPMVPFVPKTTPDLSDAALLLAGGRRDPIAGPQQTSALAGIFEAAQARVTIHWHPGGHELGQDDLVAAKQWLKGWQTQD
jgi:predicted esterase